MSHIVRLKVSRKAACPTQRYVFKVASWSFEGKGHSLFDVCYAFLFLTTMAPIMAQFPRNRRKIICARDPVGQFMEGIIAAQLCPISILPRVMTSEVAHPMTGL